MSGTPPYGFTYQDGKVVPEPAEQSTIRKIMNLRKVGPGDKKPKSYGLIAAELNREGVLNRGRFWNPTTLWAIVKREEAKTTSKG